MKSVLILILIASMTFFVNLGVYDFSFDESEYLLIGKSIQVFGYPSSWDGNNLMIWNKGNDFTLINDKYVWTWMPWLPVYITAFSQQFLGMGPEHIRIPFALFGVLSVVVLYYVAREIFSKKVSYIVALQLSLSLPFILYARQVRYYSLGALSSLLLLWLGIKFLKNKWNKKLTISTGIVLTILFFTQYAIWATWVVFLFGLSVYRKERHLISVIIFQILLATMWFGYFKPTNGNFLYFFNQSEGLFDNLKTYIHYINLYIFPVVLLPLLYFAYKKSSNRKIMVVLALLVGFKIFSMSILLVAHGKYLVELIPLLLLLTGFVYTCLEKKKQFVVAIILFMVLVSSNVLGDSIQLVKNPSEVFIRFWPKDLYTELTLKKTPHIFPQVSDYMKSTYSKGDIFWSNAYRWDIYYYSQIPHTSVLTEELNQKYNTPTSITDPSRIKWLIFFGHDDRRASLFSEYEGLDLEEIDISQFKKKEFVFHPDTRTVNHPDIIVHGFPQRKVFSDEVVIYERISQ